METLRERFKRLEGWKMRPYKCPSGHWTIAAGFNLDVNPLPAGIKAYFDEKNYITPEMAEELLTISIDKATAQCEGIWPGFDNLPENKKTACIDLVFNMGANKIITGFPSFVKAVQRQDWQRAGDEIKYSNGVTKDHLSGYWQQVGHRAEENYKLLVEE